MNSMTCFWLSTCSV